MSVKNPATYGDHYWNRQVEAARLLAVESERELSSTASRLMSSLDIKSLLPDEFRGLFNEIEAPAGAFLGDVGGRFVSEVADGAVSKTASPFFESIGYMAYMKWPTKKITPASTATLYSRAKITEEFFFERFRMGGFEPIEAKFQYDAMRPYPSIPDFMLYTRYHNEGHTTRDEVWKYFDVPAVEFDIWEWLTFQRLTTLQVHTLFRRGLIDQPTLVKELSKIGWRGDDLDYLQKTGWTMPNAMLLVQGDLQQGVRTEQILKDISIADIHPDYAQTYLDAILTKPSSQDVIAYQLRKDPDLSGLNQRLSKIGIHPEWRDVYKELAFVIPPVADIITMAVREAFTPEIARKFGQYEDYPQQLEEWGIKKGLSKEWSQRYWAAHWALPSAQQGFEMLHRGVIDRSELNMLLRALDVMPFWRDRLTRIAYRRLSRVDIRRMYGVGVLTEDEVYEAYSELGYNDRDAKRMADFTVKQILATQSKFTSRDIITAYSKYMINRAETRSLLLDVGVKEENIAFILSTADYKKEWALTDSKISAIHNLFRREVYTADQTRSELLKLDLPAERVDVLMEQWFIDEKDKPPRYWTTAQTLGFIKEGLISKERGEQELRNLGYDVEHISIYMAAAK